jgi:hypothetical protein
MSSFIDEKDNLKITLRTATCYSSHQLLVHNFTLKYCSSFNVSTFCVTFRFHSTHPIVNTLPQKLGTRAQTLLPLKSAVCCLLSWSICLSSVLRMPKTTYIREKVSETTEIHSAGFVLKSQLPLPIKKLLAIWKPKRIGIRARHSSLTSARPSRRLPNRLP